MAETRQFVIAKRFLADNIHMLDSFQFEELFYEAIYVLHYSDKVLCEIVNMLDSINVNTVSYRKKLFLKLFVEQLEMYQKQAVAMNDLCNSWSRLEYILEGLGTQCAFTYNEIVELLKSEQSSLGIHLTRLPIEYSWQGDDQDYDLGWFKKDKFKELFL